MQFIFMAVRNTEDQQAIPEKWTVYLKIDLRQTFQNEIGWDREVMK